MTSDARMPPADGAPEHSGLVRHLMEVQGETDRSLRVAALGNIDVGEPALCTLIEKVALRPTTITDGDFAGARGAGISEDQIFELVICAAVGQASRQYESAVMALEEARGGGD